MYRYHPPKASVWGHGLRKMPLSRVSDLVQRFLEEATEESRLTRSMLWTSGAATDVIQRYEKAIGLLTDDRRPTYLSPSQAAVCLDLLVVDQPGFVADNVHLSLWDQYTIIRWKHQAGQQPTPSEITVRYGARPHLGTTLVFESTEQFLSVRQILASLGLCTLNEKHLKPIRGKLKGLAYG